MLRWDIAALPLGFLALHLGGVPCYAVQGAMFPEPTGISFANRESLPRPQHEFPVVSGDALVGAQMKADLVKAIAEGSRQARMHSAMRRNCVVVEPPETLFPALRQNAPVRMFHAGGLAGGPAGGVVHTGKLPRTGEGERGDQPVREKRLAG